MSFEDFQDGHHGRYLEYLNETILAVVNLHIASHKVSAQTDTNCQETWFVKFYDGNLSERKILAVLNFHVTPMLHI